MSALDQPCPRCPALIGEPCLDRSGREKASPHASRARVDAPDPYLTPATPKPNPMRLNRHAFRCPRCGRWTPEHATQVVRDRGEWIHAACAVTERTRNQRHHILAAQDPDHCTTCGGRVHAGNRTVNIHGQIVHAGGCPNQHRRRRRPG